MQILSAHEPILIKPPSGGFLFWSASQRINVRVSAP